MGWVTLSKDRRRVSRVWAWLTRRKMAGSDD
jgi:hypothetical protein